MKHAKITVKSRISTTLSKRNAMTEPNADLIPLPQFRSRDPWPFRDGATFKLRSGMVEAKMHRFGKKAPFQGRFRTTRK
jgi:hypothetical protein